MAVRWKNAAILWCIWDCGSHPCVIRLCSGNAFGAFNRSSGRSVIRLSLLTSQPWAGY